MKSTRTEKEMLDLILNYANTDDNVRAVIMNGSRVNPNITKDPFQDYDIVYLVHEVAGYKGNRAFVDYFGEIMILQTPEDMVDPPPDNDGHYSFLMQFLDGTRIDLSLYTIGHTQKIADDSLSLVLLDKDHLIPSLPPPNDSNYLPQKPTAKSFGDCCNEFWWVSTYVGKGLWRDELTYAKYMLDVVVREELMKMLTWYFGIKTGFKKSAGKEGKCIKESVDPEIWNHLESTYADSQPEHIWDSLFEMGALFRELAHHVAKEFNFTYPEQDDENVTRYLHHIRELPQDAETIY
jgi:aminoglycoside 6-adenylyltransferase